MFHVYRQHDACDCGVACLRMIARHYGKHYSERELSALCHPTRDGVTMLDISKAAESVGFRTMGVKLSVDRLADGVALPCILHWGQHHFVVCYKVSQRHGKLCFHIADPASKSLKYTSSEFVECWTGHAGDNSQCGVALLLQPTDKFYNLNPQPDSTLHSMRLLLTYFSSHRVELLKILLAMAIVSGLQFAAPYLTQTMVDKGINRNDVGVVTLVLIAQIVVLVSMVVVGMMRNWLALYMNTCVNIKLVADFLVKLMRMPLHFFDTKLVGDLMQRIRDNERIESFLTGTSVETLFSLVNLVVFVFILACYDIGILFVFIIGNTIYITWTQCLMSRRRTLDLKRFNQLADEQDVVLQIIGGIRDIKLFDCERQKLWEWERLQSRIFHTKSKTLAIAQFQQFGALLFSQSTSILISFMAACKVIDGTFTIGTMMAVAYIIGQMTSPIGSIVDFLCSLQYARISVDRLNELHDSADDMDSVSEHMSQVPQDHTICFDHVWFSYSGADRKHVLRDVCLTVPAGKVTAVVGSSGCGKTTLLKMILGFYKPQKGQILVGNVSLEDIDPSEWRATTGCVLQDGYIFSTDIMSNIALGEEQPDMRSVERAAKLANIDSFVQKLPMGYATKVGMDGNGLSQGQKQRLLIARAIYKSSQILVLDEATNALDSKNERQIMQNLQQFYEGKTVVIAAHRLSTIRNADNIVVVADGMVVEQGTHDSLIAAKGEYYSLVSNQMI